MSTERHVNPTWHTPHGVSMLAPRTEHRHWQRCPPTLVVGTVWHRNDGHSLDTKSVGALGPCNEIHVTSGPWPLAIDSGNHSLLPKAGTEKTPPM
jgi:hypothetical protein